MRKFITKTVCALLLLVIGVWNVNAQSLPKGQSDATSKAPASEYKGSMDVTMPIAHQKTVELAELRAPNTVAYMINTTGNVPTRVPLDNPTGSSVIGGALPELIGGGDFINGVWYAIAPGTASIYTINPDNGQHAVVASHTVNQAIGMAYNPVDDKTYIKNSTQFYTVNLQTGVSTLAFTANKSLSCFTITNEGRFIALDLATDYIVEVNPTTGVTTNLFACGFDANYIQDMAIDRETNTIYWAAFNNTAQAGQLYVFNETLTGLTFIGTLPDEMVGFAIPTSATPPPPPATYDPPQALRISVSGSNVELNWFPPQWNLLSHCGSVSSNAYGSSAATLGTTMAWYSRWSVADLETAGVAANNKLSALSYFAPASGGTALATYTIKIYQGGTVGTINPGTLIYEQPLGTLTPNTWNSIKFSNPIPLDVTRELWFGISVTTTTTGSIFPMSVDNSTTGVANNNIVYWTNGTWNTLSALLGTNPPPVNLMLQAYVVDADGKAVKLNNNDTHDRGDLVVKSYNIYCDNALVGNVRGTSFTHNAPNGNHNYCVTTNYSGSHESDPTCVTASIWTCATGPSFPYLEGAEATTGTALPTCWTNQNVVGTTAWTTSAYNATSTQPTTAHSGTRKIRFYGTTRGNVSRLISPVLNLGCYENATLSFWHTQRNWTGDQDSLRVYYRTSETGTWTLLARYNTDIPDWTKETITLPNLTSTYYIAFEGTIRYGYGIQIDDIAITPQTVAVSTKPSVTALTAAMPHTPDWYTVNLTWAAPTPNTGLLGYNVYRDGLKISGNTPITTTTYSDIAPTKGSYTYAVEAMWSDACPSARTTTTITMEISPCDVAIVNYPYQQGFESGSIPMCWEQKIVKGNANVYWTVVPAATGRPGTAHSGSYKARYYYDDHLEQACKLITPMFDLSGGPAELSFWYTQEKWLQGQDNLRVYYRTSEDGDWTMIGEYTESVAAWTQVTIVLPSPGASYWIAFEGDAKEGYGVQLDDIRVQGCAVLEQLPYNEGFENVSVPGFPGCWTQTNITGNVNWKTETYGAYAGVNRAFFIAPDATAAVTRVEGPKFALSKNFDYLDLSYWYAQPANTGKIDELRVYYQKVEDGDWKKVGEFTTAAGSWLSGKVFLTDITDYLRFGFEGTNKDGNGVYLDNLKIAPCNNITDFPFTEGFNNVTAATGTILPMDCWLNNGGIDNTTPWKYVTAGTSPTVASHSAPGMIQFNSFSSPYTAGKKGLLTTPPMVSPTGEKYMEVSFWMYRDNGYATNADKVNLYVTTTRDVSAATPNLTIDRRIGQAPVVSTSGWYQYSFIFDATTMPTFFVTLEGVSGYGNNMYIDDITIKPYVCTPQNLNMVESFENPNFFPPLCWTSTATPATAVWKKVAAGTNPTCVPQDGASMIQYNCYSYSSGQKGVMTTRAFNTGSANQVLSFWMYRDNGYLTNADRVNVYVGATESITGLTPLATINRSINLAPQVAANGWYQYYVSLPCASMPVAYVSFEGVSGYGNNIYVDNIQIGNLCIPPQNVVAALYGDQYPPNHARITWAAPAISTASLTGYKVYRNGTVISTITNLTTFEYNDAANLAPGEYTYCVAATYSNTCGESEKVCINPPLRVVELGPCLPPTDMTATKHANEWYDVDLFWKNPSMLPAYCGTPNNSIGTGSAAEFAAAIRYTPEDLAPFAGKKLSVVKFVPNQIDATYTIKIWTGGSDGNPGTLVLTQPLTTASLNIVQGSYAWKSINLSSQITIDATKELWIGIDVSTTTGHPVGCDGGPIKKEGYSNIMYFDGEWTTLSQLSASLTYNWTLQGVFDGPQIVAYNVYRDNVLLTIPAIAAETYRDRTPGPGTYYYEVSGIYATSCESEARAHVTVEMEQSPCESAWNVPIIESFDGTKFAPWCWQNISSSTPTPTPWKRVTAGTAPVCQPHSGAGMLQYNSYSSPYTSGKTGLLITPLFATENDYTLKFWMYRDAGYPTNADKVNVYLSANPTTGGASLLLTVNRSMTLAPIVTAAGWYEYTVQLPTASMSGAYVIFEGVSAYGNNMYVDDISIIDERACDPVSNIIITQPSEGIVELSWNAPINTGITGYRITRNNVIIADHITETTYTDNVSVGSHEYCITALYNKPECTESSPICFQVNVIPQCDPVANVTAQIIAANTVRVNWASSSASNVVSYTLYRNSEFVTTTTQTTYLDNAVEAGKYNYSVVVNYDKACTMSEPTFSNYIKVEYCMPAVNVQGLATYDQVTLTWDYEGGDGFNEVILYEGFNNSTLPSTWLNLDKDGDGYKWIGSTGGQSGNFVGSQSYIQLIPGLIEFAVTPDNWLISPQITLSGTETLEYYARTLAAQYPAEHYGVYISTTGTNYSDFTELFSETLTASDVSWKLRTVDLTAYSGKAYIAFRHFDCTDQWAMGIDEVTITSVWGAPAFEVYRNGTILANVGTNKVFVDTNVTQGTTYDYCVRPVYDLCTVDFACAQVTVDHCTPIPVTAAYASGDPITKEVTLTWDYEGAGAQFEIRRDNQLIATVTGMPYIDVVEYDRLYTYCVKPISEICPGGASACVTAIIFSPLSTNDKEKENLVSIFPNPANTTVNVKGDNIAQIDVFTVSGQLVETIKVANGKTDLKVDVSGYPVGSYIFRIQTSDEQTINKSIVVTH